MADNITISVLGLKEFRRQAETALGRKDAGVELRRVFNVASAVVVADAATKVPNISGALAGSIRARSTRTEARIVMGKAKVPYAGFIEFGGRVGKGRTGRNTGSVRRPIVKTGRYLYPAFLRHQATVLAVLVTELRALQKKLESN
jgi:phage gpG-like protein